MKKTYLKLSAEVLLLFSLPLVFIDTYVSKFRNPSLVIFEHLYVIALFVVAVITLKMLIDRLINHKSLALFLIANLYASVLSLFLLYYGLVLIGLQSWGRVITEEFFFSYLMRARDFCESLGLPYSLVIVALIVGYVLLTFFCYLFLRKFYWTCKHFPVSASFFYTLVVFVFLFSCFWLLYYFDFPKVESKEPILMTMISGKPKQENHSANLGNPNQEIKNKIENVAREKYSVNSNAKRRNIIIFMVDGLRPDHTSVYGYARDITPNLREMDERGLVVKFMNMRSTCGETTCAHASFFASRFPDELPANMFTLQEVLKKYDYTTNFIISGDHVNFYNIRDVYGKVDHYHDGSTQNKYYFNDDNIIIDETNSLPTWSGKPNMIHYHVLSNHILGKRHEQFAKYQPQASYVGKTSGDPDIRHTNFYDNGVLQTDWVIKSVMDILRKKKYLQDALVVITSDHGESLGEHQLYSHTNSTQEELLHIPLLLIPFGYKTDLQSSVNDFMSMQDLAPTILREFDMPIPETWIGKPIQQKQTPRLSFFEMNAFRGLYDARPGQDLWKYWINDYTLEEFAFNITKDKKEMKNEFFSVSAEQKAKWRAALQARKVK